MKEQFEEVHMVGDLNAQHESDYTLCGKKLKKDEAIAFNEEVVTCKKCRAKLVL